MLVIRVAMVMAIFALNVGVGDPWSLPSPAHVGEDAECKKQPENSHATSWG